MGSVSTIDLCMHVAGDMVPLSPVVVNVCPGSSQPFRLKIIHRMRMAAAASCEGAIFRSNRDVPCNVKKLEEFQGVRVRFGQKSP